jgi:hypothetical protein
LGLADPIYNEFNFLAGFDSGHETPTFRQAKICSII